MSEDRIYIPYAFRTPRMDQSVPPNQVKPGSFGRLSGIDGRFFGGLRKFYGMKEVLDLADVTNMSTIADASGPDFVRYVTFQKRGTSTVYRGFVIRWDSGNGTSDEQIDLIYWDGSSWTKLAIWATGNTITSSLEIDCAVSGAYLLIAVDGKATKTVYWESSLVVVDSGPGGFGDELTAPTLNTSEVDTDYQLRGNGTYQIAYRFYDSTRGIYSALSAPLVVHLDHLKTTKAVGTISFASGGDSGLMIAGDVFTINSRTYEYINFGSDVTISAAAGATTGQHATALADAINGDPSALAVVTASAQSSSVLLESKVRGTAGNAYTLSVTEVEPNADDISVSGSTLTGGGVVTAEAETQVKITVEFPDDGVDGAYTDSGAGFGDLFDKIDIFRTIDLGSTTATQGAIFYLERTLDMPTEGNWNALTAEIGTLIDEALPFQTMYDPEKDIIAAPPKSGTIGRYSNLTFMAQAASVGGGYDTLSSSPEHISPEYFSTYNKRVGDPEDGRPLRFIPAGDSLFQLSYNAVVHIFKSGKLKPIQFSRLHKKRGIVGKEVAHSSGNSVFMITGLGLVILNATDGGMGSITSADRVLFDDWKSEISTVKSCYDSMMNASFFLNPTRREMVVLWHSTQVCTMLDGANFVAATSGPDISSGKNDRAFFVTATGLIVSPDNLESGSGTMWDLSSGYTLNGTATATSATTLTDANATLNDDMVGARLYMTSGANAGDSREIATIDNTTGVKEVTFIANPGNFDYEITTGDTYAVSPIPLSLRAWRLQHEEISPFSRWITSGVALKCRKLYGFDNISNDKWRVGVYRNGGTSIESTVAYPSVSSNPADSAEALNVEGIDLEPYIEQIASGVKFELTDAEFAVVLTDSRKVSAS